MCSYLRGISWIVVLAVFWSGPLPAGTRAVAEDGNIVLLHSDGTRTQITSSRADSQPDLSVDGSKTVFIRHVTGGSAEIWIAETNAPTQARRLVEGPVEITGRRFDQFFSPKFSPDGSVVYFLIAFAGTTQAIIKVVVARPDPQFVAAALDFRVVKAGKYGGNLVAQIRKAKLAPGYYEWYWLLTPEGKELGLIGQDERDVALFLEQ